MNLVASVPQGFENVLAEEIYELGADDIKTHKRSVSFKCNSEVFFKLHFFQELLSDFTER